MLWSAAETAIRAHIETAWEAGSYPAIPLVFANDAPTRAASFVFVSIEGTFAEKSIYGSTGKRSSVEGGIVFFHAFVSTSAGKATATAMVEAMTAILELQTIDGAIKLEGGNPPSPAESGDAATPARQPGGNHYRCSGSVPFIVIGAR